MTEYLTERDVDITHESYQGVTQQGNQGFEIINAFMSHKPVWIDYHEKEWYSRKNLAKVAREHIGDYLKYRWRKRNGLTRTTIEPGKDKGPIIVCGSGPSLDDYIQMFPRWPHAIMCSNSAASTIRYFGADPTYIMIFDAKANAPDTLCADEWHYDKTTLITAPTCQAGYLRAWPGAIRYYRVHDPYNDFSARVLPHAYSQINMQHAPFACSIAAQIGLAHFMGYGPIYLFGADLSFPVDGEKSRFTLYRYADGNRWVKHTYPAIKAREHWNIKVGGFLTDTLTLFYRRTILSLVYLDAPNIVSCSNGLLDGILPDDYGWAVLQGKSQKQGLDKEALRAQLGPWLAANAQFWIRCGYSAEGEEMLKLVEANDWRVQLPAFLKIAKDAGEDIDFDGEMARAEALLDEARSRGYEIFCEPRGKK